MPSPKKQPKPRKERSKRRQNSALNAAEDPIALMTHADFQFCFFRAMNNSNIDAYMKAYDVDKDNARAHACTKANQPWVIKTTNELRVTLKDSRVESARLTKEEALGLCARAARTALADVDEYDVLCTEFKTETSAFGTVKKTYKKVSPIDAIKVASKIEGWELPSLEDLGADIDVLLTQIIQAGMPQERDVTPPKPKTLQ